MYSFVPVAIIEETILALGAQPFKGCGFALDAALLHVSSDRRVFSHYC